MLDENNPYVVHLKEKKPTTKQQTFHLFCIFINWQDIVRIQLGIAAVELLSMLGFPMLKAVYTDLSKCLQTDPYNLL